jgi:hypothetical protein
MNNESNGTKKSPIQERVKEHFYSLKRVKKDKAIKQAELKAYKGEMENHLTKL